MKGITERPTGLLNNLRPIADVRLPWMPPADLLAMRAAARRHRKAHGIRNSGMTGTWAECFYQNVADFTAFANSASEGSLLAGTNSQPIIPAPFFFQGGRGHGKAITIEAKGVLSTTGTPTIIFQLRLGTTAGSSYLSGTSIGVSAAITTASGVTNRSWRLRLDLICTSPGIGTGNTTLSGGGFVESPAGFASPFSYALLPTTPPTATWTSTIDSSVTQYLNLSVTWGSASASNTITCKQLMAFGWN